MDWGLPYSECQIVKGVCCLLTKATPKEPAFMTAIVAACFLATEAVWSTLLGWFCRVHKRRSPFGLNLKSLLTTAWWPRLPYMSDKLWQMSRPAEAAQRTALLAAATLRWLAVFPECLLLYAESMFASSIFKNLVVWTVSSLFLNAWATRVNSIKQCQFLP